MTTVIGKLRKLEQEATEGPWIVHKGGYEIEDSHEDRVVGSFAEVGFGADECKANTRLSAEARNHLPALLDVVEAAHSLSGLLHALGAGPSLRESGPDLVKLDAALYRLQELSDD